MLVINLRWGESVKVTLPDGRDGYVRLVELGSKNASLGFELPRDVELVRGVQKDVVAKKGPNY